MPGLFGRK